MEGRRGGKRQNLKKQVTKYKHISDYVTCKWVNVLVKTKYCQAVFLPSYLHFKNEKNRKVEITKKKSKQSKFYR